TQVFPWISNPTRK
ncbi:UBN2 domain-containing protein, partial [Cephalotus follicularis]